MPTTDGRIPRWDLSLSAGMTTRLTFTSADALTSLSVYTGGTVDDVDVLTDATEHAGTSSDNLVWTVDVAAGTGASIPLRLVVNGAVSTVGRLRRSESGAPTSDTDITLTSDPIEVTLSILGVIVEGEGGGGATNLAWVAASSTITSDTGTDATLTAVDGSNPGLMTVAQKAKLDGIEAGATADQSAAEILTAVKTVDGTGSGLDADLLDGQEGSAFATAASLTAHEADTTAVHGIADTSALETTSGAQAKVDTHVNDITAAHAASAISIADAGDDFTATDVEGALAELQADHEADSTALSDHLADATAAHAGSAVSVDPSGLVIVTTSNVQAALAELDAALDAQDTLAVRYPLVLDDTTEPGTTEIIPDSMGYLAASIAAGAELVNNTAETSLLAAAHQFAADELAIGDVLRIEAWGTWTNNTGVGQATTVRLKGDTTNLAAILIPNTIASSATTHNWRWQGTYRIIDSTGSKLNGPTTLTLADVTAVTDVFQRTSRAITAAFDVTQPIDLDLTGDHGVADPNLSITCDGMLVFRFPVAV